MSRKPFLKSSELFLIIAFFLFGALAPVAYGSGLKAGEVLTSIAEPIPTAVQQPASVTEAEAACQMIRTMKGVEECHVMDFTAFDVIVPEKRVISDAKPFCEEAAKAIASRFPSVSGKTYKVRVSYSGEVLTTASCRVPTFLG
jgi:hypothetical protein